MEGEEDKRRAVRVRRLAQCTPEPRWRRYPPGGLPRAVRAGSSSAACGKSVAAEQVLRPPCMSTAFEPRPAEGLNYPNLVQLFAARVRRTPHAPALRHKSASTWKTLTWTQWWEAAREVAAGLIATFGLRAGDTVAICAPTRVEWILADLAVAMAGAISVPIYPSLTEDNVRYILADSGCTLLLADVARRVPEGLELGLELGVVLFDGDGERSWRALRIAGREALQRPELEQDLTRRAEVFFID